jgi:BASS family bile acid:Na+ symporter
VDLTTGILVLFISATMFTAGLEATVEELVAAFRRLGLLVSVLVANMVLVPLAGWALAHALGLSVTGQVAVILVACSPGAPFGAKLAQLQHGETVVAPAYQVLLAGIGSLTFPVTVGLLLADVGSASVPVGELFRSVAILQLVPFGVGMAVRRWAAPTAAQWAPVSQRVSGLALVVVLVVGLSSGWHELVGLLGSGTLLAGVLLACLSAVIGAVCCVGDRVLRTSMAGVAMMRNAGPAFAAVGIAFEGNPNVLAAVNALLLLELAIGLPAASRLGAVRSRSVAVATPAAAPAD